LNVPIAIAFILLHWFAQPSTPLLAMMCCPSPPRPSISAASAAGQYPPTELRNHQLRLLSANKSRHQQQLRVREAFALLPRPTRIRMKPVDIKKLLHTFDAMKGRVTYKLGAKAPSLMSLPKEIRRIDCSGLVRYAVYQAAGSTIPDGSWIQREYCEQQGFRQLKKYSDVQYAKDDGSRLFLCFIKPIVVGGIVIKAGHVWFVYKGRTLESWGGPGVDSRHWNQTVFRLRKAVAFELPTK
jgi:hypothetical protein